MAEDCGAGGGLRSPSAFLVFEIDFDDLGLVSILACLGLGHDPNT